jgi:hypothetical protein
VTTETHNDLTKLTFGEIIRGRQPVLVLSAHAIGAVIVAGYLYMEAKSSPRAFEFFEMGLPLWLFWEWWAHSPKKALPILPVLLLLLGAFFLLPLLVNNPVLSDFIPETLHLASLAVVVFFGAAVVGWLCGTTVGRPWRSRFNFDFASAGGSLAGMKLGLILLGVNVLFYVLCFTNILWSFINGDMGLYSIFRSIADICCLGGAFFGGLLVNRRELYTGLKFIFWVMLVLVFAFSMSGLLLFGTVIIIAAFSLGVLMGGGVPWKFLLVMAGMLAFLNFGKFDMRAKYLDESGTGTPPTLLTLPAYYLEWINNSLRLMGLGAVGEHKISITSQGDEGQSLYDRVDQMGSLLFITDIMRRDAIDPLYGQTYTLIPPLLIPRYFWPDKPIAHGGQVLLNIYFGRQQTLEQTEKTFVAWGWLPEAIGNFGIWRGAIFIGLVLGIMCGVAEGLSFSVRMLSIEGFVLLVFFMTVANSYEMAASIFVTSAFQATCSVLAGGILIYVLLGKKGSRSGPPALGQRRPKRFQPATPNP